MNRYTRGLTNQHWLTTGTIVAAICLIATIPCAAARVDRRLIPEEELQRLGLTRAWFTQARLDPARNHVERAVLTNDRLTVLTSGGVVQEFNAQTGESLWTAPIGNGSYPSLGPAVSDKYVALVNGSTLYVLDRTDGRPAIIRPVGGAPGAAPALAEKYVFVPLVSGRLEGYPLSMNKKDTPWFYQSSGRAMVAPLATAESVVWTTDKGFLYVGNSEKPGMRFRLDTGSQIVAPPAFDKPYVYVASVDGEVFAMDELSGQRHWKYSTGFAIERTPAPVGKRVFVTSSEPTLHCIDAESGESLWEAPHVMQFSAISKARVYGVDDLRALVVLDAAKGTQIARYAADHPIMSLVNEQTDRVYLISLDGIIECLHETDAKEPLRHNPPAEEPKKLEKDEKANPKAAQPAAAPPAKQPGQPAEPEKQPGDFGVKDNENPFGN